MASRSTPQKKRPASTSTKRRASPSKPTPDRSLLWRHRRGLFLVGLVFMTFMGGASLVLAQVDLPAEDPLLQSTFVCASDVSDGCGPGNAIATLAGEEDRVSIPLDQIPQRFIDAVLAAEDRSFFTHAGIDPIGITRAIYQEAKGGASRQGGSTITQQYAKNAFLSSERTITRKIKEAVLAIKLEREFSKTEILERYLNTVYFGRGAYGAEAAARAYFGTSIRDVDLSQAAYLAGLIRSPETADASKDIDTATFRRNSVLNGMLDEGWITAAESEAARAFTLDTEVRARPQREGLGEVVGAEYGTEYYVEYVRQLIEKEYGADVLYGGGLRVYTSLDMDYQRAAYEAVAGVLDEPDDPDASVVTVDEDGRVVALVGGNDFDNNKVNLALGAAGGGSGRQPGSSFKPLVLASAVENDISLRSKFKNVNSTVFPKANAGEDWKVSNYSDAGSEGVVDLIDATKISSNTVFAQLMLEVGVSNVVETAAAMGISADLPAVNSLTLGTGEVSVLDMANAYSTLARRGTEIDPVFITKVEQVADGKTTVLFEADPETRDAIDPETADQVTFALRQVVLSGTGTAAGINGRAIAGKTGTTQAYNDAWFVGFTPKLTTAVWLGYADLDENGDSRPMKNVHGRQVTGGSFPAQIWRDYMAVIIEGVDQGEFTAPKGFGGELINPNLQEEPSTTTTLPLCTPVSDDADSTGTTEKCRKPTPTTKSDSSTTTIGDEPDGSTTTEPKSTTTSSTSTPASSSSTTPSSTTPTTDFVVP